MTCCQVKQVLSLRDEVVLSRVLSAWCSYSQLRRLVLCGRNIKEVLKKQSIVVKVSHMLRYMDLME